MAVDRDGTIFFSDNGNWRVRKIAVDGTITTVAGSGEFGYAGDGGPATSAKLAYPGGVAADKSGNVFFADSGNHRVRKVTRDGIISTVAGTGEGGSSGDGGKAEQAQLSSPWGLVIDETRNLFVTEGKPPRVRKISADGMITTVAGTSLMGFSGDGGPAAKARLYSPHFLALDDAGNLFIIDGDSPRAQTARRCRAGCKIDRDTAQPLRESSQGVSRR